jgi:uncharacterized SAM-binding protein YcdF (DUF218 family)
MKTCPPPEQFTDNRTNLCVLNSKRLNTVRRWLRRWLPLAGGLWLLLACGLASALSLYGQDNRAAQADVIVVLGSGLKEDNRPGEALTRRAERAALLWREGYAPFVICTGGFTIGRVRSEADGCREVLEANGVPAEAILLEERSRSTEENAAFTRELMLERGWDAVLLESEAYHLMRAMWIFSDAGINVIGRTPAARPELDDQIRAVVREVIALHWQTFKKVFNLPFTYVPVL